MDENEAFYRYVEWETEVNDISIEATGSGEIFIFLDNQENPSGSSTLTEGQIGASSFHGHSGKHEIRLQFNQVHNLVVHALCFRG
ncbi:hypothetical protein V7128_10190 [Neobacillus vireti]|uniref:hypothetical protein n=1 Tax=Neobacillus vireti TaxID=220686 RepID=UPI002FFED07A